MFIYFGKFAFSLLQNSLFFCLKKYLCFFFNSLVLFQAPYFHCFFCRESRGRIHACMDPICKFIGCFTNGHMSFHANDIEHMICKILFVVIWFIHVYTTCFLIPAKKLYNVNCLAIQKLYSQKVCS